MMNIIIIIKSDIDTTNFLIIIKSDIDITNFLIIIFLTTFLMKKKFMLIKTDMMIFFMKMNINMMIFFILVHTNINAVNFFTMMIILKTMNTLVTHINIYMTISMILTQHIKHTLMITVI
ncbi:hypothetical protein NAPIS_ORF02727 [Vairimorpha apis BRL 01]|uniref:Uncharacterized protein n=1 Tax=Vairimorpha apis BRL 01 TaxID=1037528 RepID=T0MF79_9MICR|nr:hypothetical protein NAPIS_ORF02727 [Vairimorpha apis BRL 01]